MFDAEAFGDSPPGSWNMVFEEMVPPDGKPNKGRVQARGGPIRVADAALHLTYHTAPGLA